MSRGAAALGEAIREMICGRTHWKHSIKAGGVFILTLQSRQSPLMMRRKLYKRANAGGRIFARWLFWRMKSDASYFEQPTKTETE